LCKDDLKLSAIQLLAVHCVHCIVCVALVMELNKAEAPRFFGVVIFRHVDILNRAISLEHLSHVISRGPETQVADQ